MEAIDPEPTGGRCHAGGVGGVPRNTWDRLSVYPEGLGNNKKPSESRW